MKKKFLLSALSFILFMSCQKETISPDAPHLTKKELLVRNSWQVDELIHSVSGQISHYIRGSSNSTGITYDVLRFTFNTDGTGTHINQDGTFFNTSWEFLTDDDRNLKISLNGASDFEWNLVEITDSTVNATVSTFSKEGGTILESFRLVPAE